MTQRPLREACLAELLGTYVLVFLGVGAVHAAVLAGAQSGLWQVAVVWGVAVALAIHATAAVSGAHLNPAITVAMSVWRGFPSRRVGAYVAAQVAGAFLAAATLYLLFGGVLASYEMAHGIVRGQPGSELSAMALANYFPHPGLAASLHWSPSVVSLPAAMLAEAIGTALLATMIFALTDPSNAAEPGAATRPALIGLTVAALISVLAPLTQAGLNPARDLGPRLLAWLAGWGAVAIPGPRGGWLAVYSVAPVAGAVAGAAVYQYLLAPARTVRLILVGGFLGAGKTTLLWRAAQRLAARGRRVGLITNDQAPDLVDTGLLTQRGLAVREVAGSCFCCNFAALLAAADGLRRQCAADALVAEPVGSCTDLSATIVQPLRDRYRDRFEPAPLSALVDPDRLREVLDAQPGALHPSAAYIVRKQLEEADLIVLNKVDRLSPPEREELVALLGRHYPGRPVMLVSAATGEGVDAWLDFVLSSRVSGQRVVEMDYNRYAEGEAVLGWLNARVALSTNADTDWPGLARELMAELQAALVRQQAAVGHLKLLLTVGSGHVAASLTDLRGVPTVLVEGHAGGPRADLVVNARVQTRPADLEALVRAALGAVVERRAVSSAVRQLACLSPGRPNPTYRYEHALPMAP